MSENTEPKDGGPAFPFKCQGPGMAPEFYYGMSLRDWYAGQIAVGFAALPEEASQDDIDRLARYSFRLADAMLKAREQKE